MNLLKSVLYGLVMNVKKTYYWVAIRLVNLKRNNSIQKCLWLVLMLHSQTTYIVFCLKYACPIHVDPFALKYPPPPLLNVLLKANPRNMMEPESYFIYRRKVIIIRKFFCPCGLLAHYRCVLIKTESATDIPFYDFALFKDENWTSNIWGNIYFFRQKCQRTLIMNPALSQASCPKKGGRPWY